MTRLEDRQTLMAEITEACAAGARLAPACSLAGIDVRTFQRWREGDGQVRADRRPEAVRPQPAHALSEAERARIVALANEPRFASTPPARIVPALADEGIYVASEASFHRVLRDQGQMQHRGRARPPRSAGPPSTHVATGPGQVWCWDVTFLKARVQGRWFYLYLILDLFRWGGRPPTASMCQDAVVTTRVRERPAMSVSMIGLDTAKSVFQLHGVDALGKVQLKRKLRRDELIPFFEQQPRCTVVMEACGAAHHWARVLSGLGYEVKLIASEAVRPFVKRGKKTDPADAAAICTAASRAEAKFVAVKSLEQQGVLALHSVRSLLVKQQTMLANAMRGLATEFGLVVPKGMDKLKELMRLVEEDKSIPVQAREVFAELHVYRTRIPGQ
jgi:hypothetical protein